MNANKMLCKSKFSFPMQMLFTMMQMRSVYMMHMSLFGDAIHDANVLCRDEDMKFILDGASARIYP